jgi:peptidoglycan/LPS O-acetylase OafA/YrhL
MPSADPATAHSYPARFETLDAFRGLAALAVVIHHVATVYIGGMAVMAFFVISGYCISGAAASARKHDLGLGGFAWRRVKRIIPPYLLSLAFWAAYRAIKWANGGPNELARPWTDWLQNLTLTQWLTLIPHPVPYPPHNPTLFVGAYWSLCYEEQFYLVMGLLVAVAGLSAWASRWVVAILLVAGLAWNVIEPNKVYGVFLEYWAPFAFGCLVYYRLVELPRTNSPAATTQTRLAARAIDLFLVATTIVAAWCFQRSGGFPSPLPNGDELRSVPGELLTSAAFAIALLLIRHWDSAIARTVLFKPFQWLGKITFSLYLVHQFNLAAATKAAGIVLGAGNVDTPVGYTLRVAILVAIGAVFWFCCERPFLNKPLDPRRVSAAPTS